MEATQSSYSTVEEVLALFRPAAYFGLQCCTVSVLALVVYDWAVTLSREVELYWSRKTRPLSALLYFSNKYLNLVSCFVSILQMVPMSNESCVRRIVASRLSLYLSLIPPAAFTAFRAYALTRSLWLSILVLVLSSVQFIGNMVALISFHIFNVHSTAWGCVGGVLVLPSSTLGQTRLIVNRVATLVADMILIFVTWKFLPTSALMAHNTMSFSSVMFRNGILYFVVLTMMNVGQLVLTVGFPVVPDGILYDVWFMTFPLSSVLVSHFLLDLQEAHRRTLLGMATCDLLNTSHNVGTIQFNAGLLGSMGATLGFYTDQVQDGDGEEEGEGDDAGSDAHLVIATGAGLNEAEAIHESGNDGVLTMTEVWPVEEDDDFAIMEVPRIGGGQSSVGSL